MRNAKVTNLRVLQACDNSHRKTIGMALPDYLASVTGLPVKVCFKAVERCYSKQLLECEVSLNFPRLSEKGIKVLNGEA